MKRKVNYLLLLLLLCLFPFSKIWGQNPILRSTTTSSPSLSGVTGSVMIEKSGNIGIATTNPVKRLSIRSINGYGIALPGQNPPPIVIPASIRLESEYTPSSNDWRSWDLIGDSYFAISNGNTGIVPLKIGATGVVDFLDNINLNVPGIGDNRLNFTVSSTTRRVLWTSYNGATNNTSIPLEFFYDAQGTSGTDVSIMKLMPTGQVRVGNVNTTYQNFVLGSAPNTNSSIRLMVDGNIAAKGFIATQQNWADFVFYTPEGNPSLQQEETSIQENCTLIGVPTEAEAAQGRSLADNDALLLQKLEQLYLHVIELNKKVDALQLENEQLKAGLNQK